MSGGGKDGDDAAGTGIEIIERRTAYKGFFRIDVVRLRHRLFGGGWSPVFRREVFERGTAAAVLPYDPARDEVVIVEQFRLPAHLGGYRAWQLEVVAGIVDKEGESGADVVRREAREEAGLDLLDLVPMHRFLVSPGGTTEVLDLYCGRVDSSNAGGIFGLPDEHEDIRAVVKPWDEVLSLLRNGGIENGFTLLALYWLMAHREDLRRRWA
ncbi:MAG TPA: NUDIX domain-containing protein [Stellaceae bacterium]|jgi:ADP-ribose pyrophosphatase